jgi:hypothetical protein
MVQGCAHPMGPLALTDLHRTRHGDGGGRVHVRGVQGAALRSPPMLSRMVDAGLSVGSRDAASTSTHRHPRRGRSHDDEPTMLLEMVAEAAPDRVVVGPRRTSSRPASCCAVSTRPRPDRLDRTRSTWPGSASTPTPTRWRCSPPRRPAGRSHPSTTGSRTNSRLGAPAARAVRGRGRARGGRPHR